MWPIHGRYRCQTCGRYYEVPWAASSAPRESVAEPNLAALLSIMLSVLAVGVALFATPARAAEIDLVRPVNGAADAFARYTAAQRSASPWRLESIDIDASLPRLAKRGRLRAIRRLLPVGRPQYQVIEITGDRLVKQEVIARYLSEDVRASQLPPSSVAISSVNYKFRYDRLVQTNGAIMYVFSITPRKKRPGLIKGELWLDGATGIAVRQSGYLVKRPSIFVKRFEITRDIEVRNGVADARTTHLTIDTRIAGRAEITVRERPFDPANPAETPAEISAR